MPPSSPKPPSDPLKAAILRHWGYSEFRPLQEKAMRATLAGRDSCVVLPTGGGKSLCYQAPAVVMGGTTVVVSPLIALMKDQVDGLQECGVPAIQIDSSQSQAEQFAHMQDIRDGAIRLVFVSPERLVLTGFARVLQEIDVRTIAIDEAHCISHWGHDFRPEFRQLSRLREILPNASVHAYTATATERVRQDIIEQLALRDPEVLVGNFDRPNLTYRIVPRHHELKQVLDVINRHSGEGGIIYCTSRREVDGLAADLVKQGIKAVAYHAGLGPELRKQAQEAFLGEQVDVVVATVAFGMGIDRSNIRFVLHARLPKSIEHYQQETGRAGRDGLEAECVLLYSGADTRQWRGLIEKSAQEGGAEQQFLDGALQHLDHMDRYARGATCRHQALVEYFGQTYDRENCGACDLCLNDTELVPDAQVVAQKILSCVARVNQGFGIGHVISVLRGENVENVRKRGHDRLTTFGLLKEQGKAELRDWLYQLIGQGVLMQVGDEYPILKLNDGSWQVMRGEKAIRLVQIARGKKAGKTAVDAISWEGVDRDLFDKLRQLRKRLADEAHVPPYVVFNDMTLRELSRVRPSTLEKMRSISGIGDEKLRKYGKTFLEALDEHCQLHTVSRDQRHGPGRTLFESKPVASEPPTRSNAPRDQAYALFRRGASLEEVARQTGRRPTTVIDYLTQFILEERPRSVAPWVPEEVSQRVMRAARELGTQYLRPIFVALGEKVPYDQIRVALTHATSQGQ